MKKFNLWLIMFVLVIGLTGCDSSDLKNAYKKMSISDKMNGYRTIIDISGIYDNENINDKVYINNYMNTDYEITNMTDTDTLKNENLYFVKGTMYELKDDIYVETSQSTPYTNTNVYLESLTKAMGIKKIDNETISDKSYNVYSYNILKSSMLEILKYTSFSNVNLNNNVTCKAYIDGDGYIYQIIFLIKDSDNTNFTVKVSFDKYNEMKQINVDNYKINSNDEIDVKND